MHQYSGQSINQSRAVGGAYKFAVQSGKFSDSSTRLLQRLAKLQTL